MKDKEVYAIEISKDDKEFWNEWTLERIKNAFNYGHGSIKDFKRYMNDNKKYCNFKILA